MLVGGFACYQGKLKGKENFRMGMGGVIFFKAVMIS